MLVKGCYLITGRLCGERGHTFPKEVHKNRVFAGSILTNLFRGREVWNNSAYVIYGRNGSFLTWLATSVL